MNKRVSQRFSLLLIIATLALSIFVSSFCVFSFSAGAVSVNGLNTITDLNLRSSNSTSSSVVTLIPENSEVILLANSSSGWSKVKYGSYTGYCSNDYLNALSGSGVTMKGKTTDDVNLRSGMGTSYSSLAVVPNSTTVTVTSNSNEDWAKVTYSGKTGYIKKDYLEINFTMSSSAQTTPTVAQTQKPTENDFSYIKPDLTGLPLWYNNSLTDSLLGEEGKGVSKIMLSKSDVSIDINEVYKINAFSSGDMPIAENLTFSSSNTKVAVVDDKGNVTGKSTGKATIVVKDPISQYNAECIVTVSSLVAPTVTATQKPTSTPTVKPTVTPTTKPTSTPTQTPTINNALTISQTKATIYVGNDYLLKATSDLAVSWKSSNTSVATVANGLVVAKAAGTATITASTSSKSVSCTITVKSPTTSVNISHGTATVTAGKTFLAYSSTSGVTWKSSDTSVCTVNNGYIYGVSAGKAIVTVSKSGGAATMVVTVTQPAPIRFAYTSPNCATKNGTVTLLAITDSKRSAVKFDVTVGSTTKTVNATTKTADGSNLIWKATTSFSDAGTYNVKAYSKTSSSADWLTCSDAATTVFVANSTDKNTTVCAKRRASDEIINLIANYEGFISSVYADPLTGDPTLGYGRVVYSGQQFYNNLSKTEAFAYLVQTVNNDGYTSKVNSFLVDNSVKFNQQQFDALVCFVYNTGTGVLSYDDELRNALLDCSSGTSTNKTTYYINGSNVRIRKGAGTSYDIIKELSYGTTLTILDKSNASWYYVQLSDGTKGYVSSDYIASRVSSGSLDLNYVKKQNLINKFCQYHHANGCIYGLLYRRVDEMEVFFYNDYSRNYGTNNYNISFTCASNSSFHT